MFRVLKVGLSTAGLEFSDPHVSQLHVVVCLLKDIVLPFRAHPRGANRDELKFETVPQHVDLYDMLSCFHT